MTCYTHNGSSLIDYVLCSQQLFSYIDLKVGDISSLSDHCLISTEITLPGVHKQAQTSNYTNHDTPYISYKWKPQFQEDYLHNINSEVTQHKIHNLYTRLSDSHVIDGSAITQFTNILLDANTKCRTVCTSSLKSKLAKNKDALWYDSECKELRKKFITTRNSYKNTNNKEQLQLINESRNTYGRCCRIKKAKHDYKATQQCQLKYDNPRSFWKGIRPRKHVDCPIDVQTFYAYFTEINTAHTNTTHININHQYPITCVESLDREITAQEVDYVITHLQRNKSPGADNILNECLISGKENLIHLITLIFNILYNTSTFPEQWSEGIVIPIFKKGDICVPSNYRPITLLSCVSKVFTSLLCKRITSWATENFVFSEAQFGFRPGYSTIDAIFTLSSLIRQGKPGQKLCIVHL